MGDLTIPICRATGLNDSLFEFSIFLSNRPGILPCHYLRTYQTAPHATFLDSSYNCIDALRSSLRDAKGRRFA